MAYETYEPVIGLEVHVQLQTDSKIFSTDAAAFGADPNTQVDPVSLGHPGTLPVLNENVVEYALRLGLATNCSVASRSVFARKHYFYPDLPKGYQISQYDTPICYDGYVEIYPEEDEADDEALGAASKRIGLTRIHMEEDAGKSIHQEAGPTRLDFNRCGVPLLEMVTEPDLRTPREAYLFLKRLRQLVRYLGISDGNMEEGSLRCDANVSVRPRGRETFGTRTELKNMNSMSHVEKALDYEIARQIAALERGESVQQQTLLWDPDAGTTHPMRSKEEAHDYRYMPDPDLVEVEVDDEKIDEVRADLPELPRHRRRRFVDEVGLPPYDARVLTEERDVADYFEAALDHLYKRTKGGDTDAQAKLVSNLVMTEVMRVLNDRSIAVDELPVEPERLAQLAFLRVQDKVSSNGAQEVFEAMLEETGKSAGKIADERDLIQVSDADAIAPVVESVVDDHPEQVETYLGGKDGLLGFFIGQVMQRFDGSPDPELVRKLLREELEDRREAVEE
jgi:aspartyl-tRNA(Asn)/glutamyl-tRNA(Gln) amidotransferase subunit B